ncbi:MAG: 16S rRNA (adenine(1518)-N(6)/adenine(1519)-N(6))-dimethyltransferase RsmA [Bacteroidales bacterium]|nr:16S rRNA (adenine(1518)-N(6)/adenine(1519)-N(6))-dimethyltransferase RsmA [Bacteroidales bacterium]
MGSPVRAKKNLGQHFLRSSATAKDIADCLPLLCKNCLEIGPGMGILTQHLFDNPIFVNVFEIDGVSIDYLLANDVIPSAQCIQGDFLQLPVSEFFGDEEFMVMGNFPYNISSQIVFKVIENRQQIPVMAGMFQREVARRICSPAGSKEYGILSVLVQAFYDTKYHFTVDENEFNPPPKVKSGVMSMVRKENYTLPCDEKLFFEVVKTAFNQRRKTLNNSLKKMLKDKKLDEKVGLKRPEQLSVIDFIELTNFIAATE